jgi:hypothetical protein
MNAQQATLSDAARSQSLPVDAREAAETINPDCNVTDHKKRAD